MSDTPSEWYWSLTEGRAVLADERGPADDVLGPYPTRTAAENWRDLVEERNETWDEQDRAWRGDDNEDGQAPPDEP